MSIGRKPNERLIVDYLEKRQAALFAGAREARLQNKTDSYAKFREELTKNERALKATRVKPGQSENSERLQDLVKIFTDIYNQAHQEHKSQLKFPRVAVSLVADLLQTVFPEQLQQLDMKVVSSARAQEVLDFVLTRYAPGYNNGNTQDEYLGVFNVLNVERKPRNSKVRP
jgi:hypothetical protein